jgi:hypothetical protein
LEFWRQLGQGESWYESDEPWSCERGGQKVACSEDRIGRWKVLERARNGYGLNRGRRISGIGGGRRIRHPVGALMQVTVALGCVGEWSR